MDFVVSLGDLIQLFAILVAAWAIHVGLRGVRNQIRVSVFSDYTKRYSEIIDQLPNEARDPMAQKALSNYSSEDQEQIVRVMRNYLNMCSEELFLAQSGNLDEKVWEIWRTGIRATADLKIFQDVWDKLSAEYDAYPDFKLLMQESLQH